MKMKLYQNVRGAEARARSFDLSCAELRSHSPKTLFFALKNTDFVAANILREKDAIRKYARRWGQSTILRILLSRAAISCSQNHIFIRKNDDRVLAPRVDYYWPQDGHLDAPRRRQLNFLDLDPPKPQEHAPKTLFFTRKIEDFMFWDIMMAQAMIQKYARRWGQRTIFGMMLWNLKK